MDSDGRPGGRSADADTPDARDPVDYPKVVLVTGAGKAFSAGGDFDLIEDMIESQEERMRVWKEAKDLVYNVVNCNKPIVSAITRIGTGMSSSLHSSRMKRKSSRMRLCGIGPS